MFQVEQMEDTTRAVLPTMMGSLLLRVGAANGIEKANADGRDPNACVPLLFLLFFFS